MSHVMNYTSTYTVFLIKSTHTRMAKGGSSDAVLSRCKPSSVMGSDPQHVAIAWLQATQGVGSCGWDLCAHFDEKIVLFLASFFLHCCEALSTPDNSLPNKLFPYLLSRW